MKFASFLHFFSLFLLLSGCNRDTCCDEPLQEMNFEAPAPQEFINLQETARETLSTNIIFQAEQGLEHTSDNGMMIIIPQGCFTSADGQLIDGDITLEFIELYDRNDMLVTNKPSMGQITEQIRSLLIGERFFYLNLTRDGQQIVSDCGIQIRVPISQTGDAAEDMFLWEGMENENDSFFWNVYTEGEFFTENGYYVTYVSGNGWKGIAHAANYPGEKAGIQVLASDGYNGENAAVYLAYADEKHAIAQLYWDNKTSMFTDPYRQFSPNLDIHLLFISAEGEQWRYAVKSITAEADKIYTIAHSETSTATLTELLSVIAKLP
ncbi:hypothetical protein [Sinomicrobium pectinilyticum]|nr:hypothetical protein [Sinomicrobium pectinilyticum]